MTFTLAQSTIPAILIEGSQEKTRVYTEQLLQDFFCRRPKTEAPLEPGTCYCAECRRISQHQHAGVLWICPEKDYTLEDVDIIFDRARFLLDAGQRFFIVLDKAQTLTLATANRLLKILEEPPAGYTFLLLTNNQNVLLPTIRSRTHQIHLEGELNTPDTHPLTAFFYEPAKLNDPATFQQVLSKETPSESETVELCCDMLHFFAKKQSGLMNQSGQITSKELEYLKQVIAVLTYHLRTPPGPGSAAFFWKRLFLNFPRP